VLFRIRPVVSDEAPQVARPAPRRVAPLTLNHPQAEAASVFGGGAPTPAAQPRGPIPFGSGTPRPARTGGDDVIKTVRREEPKVGRNDPCPCGSGKKYKKCHGQAA
jgi:preprotein translocase subunit SecA